MAFKHFLAFGNSDQESFRNAEVHRSFDVMTVPGTIASYYSAATAAFVLSSQLDYMIDPRTPLFQGPLSEPRASHLSLATWHGEALREALESGVDYLQPSFFTDDIVARMVSQVTEKQFNYEENAVSVKQKISRYALLLAEAMKSQGMPEPAHEVKAPAYVLAPYFAVTGLSDLWLDRQREIWKSALNLSQPSRISPVICVDGRMPFDLSGPKILEQVLERVPAGLSTTVFFWITDFDERRVSPDQLKEFWSVIREGSESRVLMNLYGSFFSICAQHAGLGGFSNGLTYSESRSWPALASTGAAPPRYYIPKLHSFLPVALAATLLTVDSYFACDCSACTGWIVQGNSIASLPYHDLKRHFALARENELIEARDQSLANIAASLREALSHVTAARTSAVLSELGAQQHLETWATVFDWAHATS